MTSSTSTRSAHNRWVATSYDGTYPYHRLFWARATDLALHGGYWDDQTRTHSEALINMNRKLAERVAISSSDRILDAGCGIGGSAIWLARMYGSRVLGITVSHQQARLARRFATERQVAHLASFAALDYTAMALPDASFDIVWALESVAHAQDKFHFFSEGWRVLKPGGRLIMFDWLRRARDYSADNERMLKRWLAGFAIPDMNTPTEYMEAMHAVGFTDIQFEDISAHVRRSCRRMYLLSFLGIPVTYLLSWAHLQPEWLIPYTQSAYGQYIALKRGLWLQGIFSARKES
jgi:tocopherol O-methyltransferase